MPAAEIYGFLRGCRDAQLLPPVFLELGREDAVFPQGTAFPFQLPAHADVEVVAVDDKLQIIGGLSEGTAQPEDFMVKVPAAAVIKYVELRCRQLYEGLSVNLPVEGLHKPPVQLVYIIQ